LFTLALRFSEFHQLSRHLRYFDDDLFAENGKEKSGISRLNCRQDEIFEMNPRNPKCSSCLASTQIGFGWRATGIKRSGIVLMEHKSIHVQIGQANILATILVDASIQFAGPKPKINLVKRECARQRATGLIELERCDPAIRPDSLRKHHEMVPVQHRIRLKPTGKLTIIIVHNPFLIPNVISDRS
jgi:hypothetical protein